MNLKDRPVVVLITVAAAVVAAIGGGLIPVITYITGESTYKSFLESRAKSKEGNSVPNAVPSPAQEFNAGPTPTQEHEQTQQQSPEYTSSPDKPSQAAPEQAVIWYTATIENCTNTILAYSVQNHDGSYGEHRLQAGYHTTFTLKNPQVIVRSDPNTSDGATPKIFQLNSLQTVARQPTELEKQSAPINCFEEDENGNLVKRIRTVKTQ